jgi:formylglycine-generating enzyme required for sulfatase activity
MKKLKLYTALLISMSLGTAFAGEGLLALTTVPQDAEIYVDCQLKAKTTPVILPLSSGNHQIEIKKDGQEVRLNLLMTDGAVIAKKLVLIDSPPSLFFKGNKVNISEISDPKRDSFETEAAFQARRQDLLENRDALIEVFNQAVQQHDLNYQAGVAYLDKEAYDINSKIFPVRIEWKAWAKVFDLPKQSYIFATVDQAKALWQEGQQKPVFISLASEDNQIKANKFMLTGMDKKWPIVNTFRDSLLDVQFGPKMVIIPTGNFMMGDIQGTGYQNEQPVHQVSVGSFAMSVYEITFADYDLFTQATGREPLNDQGWGRDNRPVINISWQEATAYVEWLSEQTGQNYRLPTEAEWEYAARAGTTTQYWWGNEIGSDKANCANCDKQWDYTAPTGSFAPNPFGLYDTAGNVREWTCSAYEKEYQGAELRCATQDEENQLRVIRGGSWYNWPRQLRAADRSWKAADIQVNNVGFRIVRR